MVQPESPWKTIPAMLQDRFALSAEQEALVDGPVRLTYGQLETRVMEAASAMRSLGVRPGSIVVIWAPNSWQWVVTALACWWLGGVVVPISARHRALDVLPVLLDSGAGILFCSSESGGLNLPGILQRHVTEKGLTLQDALPRLEHLVDFDGASSNGDVTCWDDFLHSGSGGDKLPSAEVAPEDTCMILFTSGTTGRPKGVMRGHHQVLRARWQSSRTRGFTESDRLLVIPPFSHVAGLNNGLLRCVLMGMTHVLVRQYQPPKALELLVSERISAMLGPPSLYTQLLREEGSARNVLAQLRLVQLGASPIPPGLVHELDKRGVPRICASYGMTECEVICETDARDAPEVVATTVGRPVSGVSVKLVDEHGADVAASEVGEVLVSGYPVMQGYFGDERATRAVLGEDGWLATGDLGKMSPDGNLQIVGRRKDMIICHGLNVYPAEVENQLMESGQLSQVAVVGRPSRLGGEEAVAFVVPSDPEPFEPRHLTHWARDNLAAFKLPQKIIVCEELPLNVNGKVDKQALRDSL